MDPIHLRRALTLGQADRESWLVHFLDERGRGLNERTFSGIAFPLLARDQTPVDYIVSAYSILEREYGARDRLRLAVVNALQTECAHWRVSKQSDVLGRALNVARRCGFTEVQEKLLSWIHADAYPTETCWDGRRTATIRALVWLTLLTWDLKHTWLPFLIRDLRHNDCTSLCFRAIGRLDVAEAVQRIPVALSLKPAYSRALISDLIRSLGPEGALDHSMLGPWQTCMSTIERDTSLEYLLYRPHPYDPDSNLLKRNPLTDALRSCDLLLYRAEDGTLTLRSRNASRTLVVNLLQLEGIELAVIAQREAAIASLDFDSTSEALAGKYGFAGGGIGIVAPCVAASAGVT